MSYEDRFFTTKRKIVKRKARNAQCFILEKTPERACNTSVFCAFFPRHLTPHQTTQMNEVIIAIIAAMLIIAFVAIVAAIFDELSHLQKEVDKAKNYKYDLPDNKPKTMYTELDDLIAETKGKFFSITFVKKDGSVRVINGKDKYQRLLNGGVYKIKTAGYVPFVNRNTETWASAHKDAVVTFRCGKLVKEISA